jgi:hypothetical protein
MLGFVFMFVAVCVLGYFLNKAMWKAEEDNARIMRELTEPRCPHCGYTEFEYGDCYDSEWAYEPSSGKDVVLQSMNGHCKLCKTPLTWVEVYELVGYENVREIL